MDSFQSVSCFFSQELSLKYGNGGLCIGAVKPRSKVRHGPACGVRLPPDSSSQDLSVEVGASLGKPASLPILLHLMSPLDWVWLPLRPKKQGQIEGIWGNWGAERRI